MSDWARNYVKKLDAPWHLKSFLLLVADYHDVNRGVAWPALTTLADVMGKDVRHIRRLIQEATATGKFSYVAGIGRGNLGEFRFVELQKEDTRVPFSGRKEDIKGDTKEDKFDNAIRKNHRTIEPKPSSNPRSPLSGGAAAATGICLTSRDLRNVAKELDKFYEAPHATDLNHEDVFELICERLCLNPGDVRAAMGKKEPGRVSA